MIFFQKDNPDRFYFFALWLSVIALPWPIVVSNISIILLALMWLFQGDLVTKRKKLLSSKWALPFILFYVLHFFGLLYSANTGNGFLALEKKATFLALPLIVATGPLLDERFFQSIKRGFIYSCFVLTLFCLTMASINFLSSQPTGNFDVTTLNHFNRLHPESSPLWMHFSYIQLGEWAEIHPAYFSMYLAFCLVLLFTDKPQSRSQLVTNFLIALFITLLIALMSSRMAIIALVASILYLIFNALKEKQSKVIVLMLVAIFILGGLVWINPVSRFRVIEEPLNTSVVINKSTTEWNSFNYRILEWKAAWSIITQHFLAGIGTGGSDIAMKDFYTHFNESTIGVTYNPHNQYLQTWIELGVIGLTLFLACLFVGFWKGIRRPDYTAFIIIFGLMCLTESMLERQKGIVFFTLFQSLYLSFERPLK